MHSTRFVRFLGLDLGGGRGKRTALATLRATPQGALVEGLSPRHGQAPLYDEALVDAIRAHGPRTLLAVDAPLTLPACLRCAQPVCPGQTACIDPAVVHMRALAQQAPLSSRDARRGKPALTPYTQRVTELHLQRIHGIVPREALGQGVGPLAARAAHLVRALADRFTLNETLIEVYPKATLALCGFETLVRRYKKHMLERQTRLQILDALANELTFAPGVWREECVQSDHLFDAVMCAYTGYLWDRDEWRVPANVADLSSVDGWIWVPPPAEAAANARVSSNGAAAPAAKAAP